MGTREILKLILNKIVQEAYEFDQILTEDMDKIPAETSKAINENFQTLYNGMTTLQTIFEDNHFSW